jgi:hypothetical protein
MKIIKEAYISSFNKNQLLLGVATYYEQVLLATSRKITG